MGASSSQQGGVLSGGTTQPVIQTGTNHGPIPEDMIPYTGPAHEFRVTIINTKLKAAFGISAGKQVTFSDVQEYYSTLQQQYGEYFRLVTFFRVPAAQQSSGFASFVIPFHGKHSFCSNQTIRLVVLIIVMLASNCHISLQETQL